MIKPKYPSIIKSLLDTDYYKFTMGQFAWQYFPKVKVRYAFKNRTKTVKLGNFIKKSILLEQLDYVRSLRFSLEELNYLKGLGIFSNDYLSFLNTLTLPPVYVDIKDGELSIETEGLWPEAIINKAPSAGLWEGQTDEDGLGHTYEQLDKTLDIINNSKKETVIPITNLYLDIMRRIEKNKFKSELPKMIEEE